MVELEEVVAGARDLAVYELLRQRLVKSVPIANPAAGSDWSTVVPPGVVWELISARTRLNASAVVGNRFMAVLLLDPNGAEIARMTSPTTMTAGLAFLITALAGLGASATGGTTYLPLATPPQVLAAGSTVASTSSGLDAGDQYTGTILTVREWSPRAVETALDWFADHYR